MNSTLEYFIKCVKINNKKDRACRYNNKFLNEIDGDYLISTNGTTGVILNYHITSDEIAELNSVGCTRYETDEISYKKVYNILESSGDKRRVKVKTCNLKKLYDISVETNNKECDPKLAKIDIGDIEEYFTISMHSLEILLSMMGKTEEVTLVYTKGSHVLIELGNGVYLVVATFQPIGNFSFIRYYITDYDYLESFRMDSNKNIVIDKTIQIVSKTKKRKPLFS